MRYIFLFFLLFYTNLKAIEAEEKPEPLPEELLIMSLDKISQGNINGAIDNIIYLSSNKITRVRFYLIYIVTITARLVLIVLVAKRHKSYPDVL